MLNNQEYIKQKKLCDEAWESGDFFTALEINKKLLEIDTDNILLVVNCMSNSMMIKKKEQGIKYYELCIDMLKNAKNKLKYNDGNVGHLMPWTLQNQYLTMLMNAEYWDAAAGAAKVLVDFYCKAGVLRGKQGDRVRNETYMYSNKMPLPEELDMYFKTISDKGYKLPQLREAINEYHNINHELNKPLYELIDKCYEKGNFFPISDGYDDKGIIYVVDKKIDLRNVFFDLYDPMNDADQLLGGKGVYSERAVMVFTSIDELINTDAFGIARRTNLEEIIDCLKEPYGEIVINPSSEKYLTVHKNLVNDIVKRKRA